MSRKKTRTTDDECQLKENKQLPRRFVARLRDEYAPLVAALSGIKDSSARARYASLLLYRLTFIYSLQHLGLLAGDRRYLQHHLALACDEQPGGTSFYRSFLRPLFAGAKQAELPSLPLTALFLNHTGERNHPDLALSDEIFGRLFAFFDTCPWPSTGQSISGKCVLSLEMFDSLLEQEECQKEMGAYYTPADVTAYIARTTLLPVLFTRACALYRENEHTGEEIIWQQLAQQPTRYIFPTASLGCELALPAEISAGLQDIAWRQCWQKKAPPNYAACSETWREVVTRRLYREAVLEGLQSADPDRLNRLVTWNLDQQQLALDILRNCQRPAFLEAFYQSLRSLAILDPTCGLGAFLLAAIPVLESLYIACLTRMQELLAQLRTTGSTHLYHRAFHAHLAEAGDPSHWRHTVLTWINERNLYGVDLMEEAVEICRQRLFLKILAALPDQNAASFPADFGQHICVGNSLIGSLHVDLDGQDKRQAPGKPLDQFHWHDAFPAVMKRGGFDAVIGNPPYVAYKRIRQSYPLDGYITLESGNLYAPAMERGLRLLAPGGRFGMIVPTSATCTDGYNSLQQMLLAQQELHIASFSDQRGRLFALRHPRLCIVLCSMPMPGQTGPSRVFTTSYLKLERSARSSLFERIRYTEVTHEIRPGIIPRYSSPLEKMIQRKLARQAHVLGHYLRLRGEYTIYYTRKLSWFVQITPFIPLILDAQGNTRTPSELKFLRFSSLTYARIAFAALNSNLFYWLLSTTSDCRNLNMREVRGLPLDLASIHPSLQQKLCQLSEALENDLRARSLLRSMHFKGLGQLTIQCIYPAHSRPLIDEVDRVLADHYDFTDEELDFLLHYDGKYRQPH